VPGLVRQLPDRLEGVVVARREPAIDQPLCGVLGLGLAERRGLEGRAQEALGRDRMIAHPGAVAVDHAAEVLRPRPIAERAHDHAADPAGAQLLRLGRKAEEGIGAAGGEQLHGVAIRRHDPLDVLIRVEADVLGHDRDVQAAAVAEGLDTHAPALQVTDAADRLARE
jgi:hypothetical protein